jgi:hypothetical protein
MTVLDRQRNGLKGEKLTILYFAVFLSISIKIALSSCFLLMKKVKWLPILCLGTSVRCDTLQYVGVVVLRSSKALSLHLPLHSSVYTAALFIQIYRLTTTPERLVVAKKSFLHAMALRAIVKPVAKVQDRTSVLCLYRSARTHCFHFAALYNVMRNLTGWHQLHIQKPSTTFTELLSRSFHA